MGVSKGDIPSRVYIPLRQVKFFVMSIDTNDPRYKTLIDNAHSVVGTGLSRVESSDPMYQTLYDANPYRNLTYHQSGWQKFLSLLGFRTDYDRWLEEAQLNANEYDAQVASIMQQNQYNDPAAQASRMRAAGQNPDLLGTSGVAESASPVQDVNGMNVPETNSFDQARPVIEGFFGAVVGAISKGFVFAKDIVGFTRDLETRDITMLEKLNQIADDYVTSRISSDDMSSKENFQARRQYLAHALGSGKSYRRSVAYDLGVPRRWRRVFEKAVGDRAFSLSKEVELWDASNHRLTSRGEIGSKRKSKAYSEEDSVMDAFNGPIAEARDEIAKIKIDNDKTAENLRSSELENKGISLDVEKEYLDTLYESDAGKHKAMAENQDYLQNYYANRIKNIIKSTSAKITENLQKDADAGSVLAKGCLLAWSLSDMLNFSFGDAIKGANTLFNPTKGLLSKIF